jgi:hypothetical protein
VDQEQWMEQRRMLPSSSVYDRSAGVQIARLVLPVGPRAERLDQEGVALLLEDRQALQVEVSYSNVNVRTTQNELCQRTSLDQIRRLDRI